MLVGLAATLILGLAELKRIDDLQRLRSTQQRQLEAVIAQQFESSGPVTPLRIAEWDRLVGGRVRISSNDESVTAEGITPGRGGNAGAPIPALPGRRVSVILPDHPDGVVSWFPWNVLAAGLLATIAAGFLDRRRRRDLARLRRELQALGGPGDAAQPMAQRRLTLPADRGLQEVVQPLNEVLLRWGGRIDTAEHRRRRHDLTMGSMNSGIIAIDAQGRIDGINDAARSLFDLTAVAPMGLVLSEVVQVPEVHEIVRLAIDEGRTERRTVRRTHSTGDGDREITVVAAPIIDRNAAADPGIAGCVLLADDVTDLRRLERSRTEFVGNVSHELRTPLTNLLGYLSTVKDLAPEEQDLKDRFLATAERSAVRLARIIEDLLDLARLEAPGHTLEYDRVRIRPLLDRVAERHQAELAEDSAKSIHIECEPGIELLGSASLIEQAVDNLTSNALRYGGEEAQVLVRASETEGTVRLMVEDHGPGIPPRHLPRLFERFYRVDTARSRETGGTGLGLAIVKHIAAAHGGRVQVESQLGVGTRFWIELPARSTGNPV